MIKSTSIPASESEEQQALFQWAEVMQSQFPELALLYHVPNGGQRSKTTARRLKSEGVKSGVPDVTLPVARGTFHGLYVEMKAGKNKPTLTQLWWIEQLTQQGYYVVVAYGWQEAATQITKYLEAK